MNIKKYKLPLLIVSLMATILSCTDEFLDVEAKGTFLSSNYYANETEAFTGVVAIYDMVRKNSGGFENMITMMNAGSDDFYAGGGGPTDGAGIQSFSNYTLNKFEMPVSFWSDNYVGVYRANILIQKLPGVPMNENLKARFMAESKALRGYYHFNLVRMFKNVPLFTEPVSPAEMYNVLQATPEAVYKQIEDDLIAAIPNLPTTLPSEELGRLTQGAARAILGKVYLEQDKKTLAAEQLALVNGTTPGGTSQYGYKLLDNFKDLWLLDSEFNTESILEVQHTNLAEDGNWNWQWGRIGNMVNTMNTPRSYVNKKPDSNTLNLEEGWGFNPMTTELYDLLKFDPRFNATVLDMKALVASGNATYSPSYQDTGYFLRKHIAKTEDKTPLTGDHRLNNRQNSYIIRLADTYLLEAEALNGTGARAQALLDAVRARVGLPSVPVSMNAILNERRIELAGEGHRWFDLRRNNLLTSKLADRGFTAGKHEIFPIPYKELENTKLVQNPNY